MNEPKINEIIKNNWIGRRILYQGVRHEVIDTKNDELQVIPSGKWQAKWIKKEDVRLQK